MLLLLLLIIIVYINIITTTNITITTTTTFTTTITSPLLHLLVYYRYNYYYCHSYYYYYYDYCCCYRSPITITTTTITTGDIRVPAETTPHLAVTTKTSSKSQLLLHETTRGRRNSPSLARRSCLRQLISINNFACWFCLIHARAGTQTHAHTGRPYAIGSDGRRERNTIHERRRSGETWPVLRQNQIRGYGAVYETMSALRWENIWIIPDLADVPVYMMMLIIMITKAWW